MLRLSTPDFKRFVTKRQLLMLPTAVASKRCAALSLRLNGTFVSKVRQTNRPAAINHLRRLCVDTQFVARGGKRLGIYFPGNRRFYACITSGL